MKFPTNITRDHLLKAISKINSEGIPKDGDSQYYDVVYDGKVYPPKLVVSYANIFANKVELDRKSFEGGKNTPCFKLLEENDFIINEKIKYNMKNPNIWFVTQGATYSPEKGMKFLWAPTRGADNRSRFYWENLTKVKKGDFIFNYSGGLIGVSVALTDGYAFENLEITSEWQKDGYRVDIELYKLNEPIKGEVFKSHKNEILRLLKTVKNKPFNKEGGVNQGYLYEFTKEAGIFIKGLYGKPFGNKVIDDFFHQSDSPIEIGEKFKSQIFNQDLKKSGLYLTGQIQSRFITSLLSKPFLILTGLSGSGKSKLAEAFCRWICSTENQYCLVPVGADWTNREPLLGYPNAIESLKYVRPDNDILNVLIRAKANSTAPHFIILDEMNLSHVERYFADFLSVMESKGKISLHKRGETLDDVPGEMTWPKNLFIIGTVNIDETTYMFSPKVLDRAHVIEFRISADEMADFFKDPQGVDLSLLDGKGRDYITSFLELAKPLEILEVDTALTDELNKFFVQLKSVGAEFGYRTAHEIVQFHAKAIILEAFDSENDIIDAAIMQKLLPKLHGSRNKLKKPLESLAKLCVIDDSQFIEKWLTDLDSLPKGVVKYSLSFEKIGRMYRNLLENGYTSYAEA